VDDKTQATFPAFTPQAPMFTGETEQVEATAPETTKPKRRSTRTKAPPKTPARATPKPRGQRRTMPATGAPEAVTPKKARKVRQPKGLKLDLATALSIASNLKEDDVHLLGQIADALKAQSKRSRVAIVTALVKLFG
jgi:hypothetical protein